MGGQIYPLVFLGLKQINIKNRDCYYFDDMIKTEDFDFDHILLDEK